MVIPVRFSGEEKYLLQIETQKAGMSLSSYLHSKLRVIIAPQLALINKTTVLIHKIRSSKLDPTTLIMSEQGCAKMRADFKLMSE